jgi:hypothetical protein
VLIAAHDRCRLNGAAMMPVLLPSAARMSLCIDMPCISNDPFHVIDCLDPGAYAGASSSMVKAG